MLTSSLWGSQLLIHCEGPNPVIGLPNELVCCGMCCSFCLFFSLFFFFHNCLFITEISILQKKGISCDVQKNRQAKTKPQPHEEESWSKNLVLLDSEVTSISTSDTDRTRVWFHNPGLLLEKLLCCWQ